jgi:hypothetical protein
MGDVDLYRKLRNTTDKLGGLTRDAATGGITYASEDGILVNGVILATKLHEGWNAVLGHDWGHPLPAAVPDVSDMQWDDLLPADVYDLDPERPLPEPVEGRDCPNCLWGDPARAGGEAAASQPRSTPPSS